MRPNRSATPVSLTLALLFMIGGPAAAQNQAPPEPKPEPRSDPALNDPSVREKADEMDRPRGLAPALAPTGAPEAEPVTPGVPPESAIPGLESSDHAVTRAPLRREGTFLVRQRGSMVRLRTGAWAFVFQKDAAGNAERPMILVPSSNLSRMEHLAADRAEGMSFLLTGQVFAYLGRNYILPTRPPVLVMSDRGAVAPDAPDTSATAPPAMTRSGRTDPEVDQLLKELESQREAPPAILTSPPMTRAPDAGSRAPDPVPEGAMISRRRGRLVRQPDGETAFVIDTDADTSAAADPPYTLVPCLTRERMENQAARMAEVMIFEVSGRVLAYQGRNYLIPTMFQAYPSSDLSRRQ
jgi:hypothetical protein